MSRRITKREVKETHLHVIAVPYCALQYLLCCRTPYAHTERREGWGADIYDIGTCAIVTGNAPFGDVKPSYEVFKKYEDAAKCIRHSDALLWDYENQKAILDALIWEFVDEALGKRRKIE